MSTVEELKFDSNLFRLKVGRIDLDDHETLQDVNDLTLQGRLRHAFDIGMNVVYIFSPLVMKDGKYKSLSNSKVLPGIKVDEKTTYKIFLASLSREKIIKDSFLTSGINVSSYTQTAEDQVLGPPEEIKSLAISAGEWSRFRTDTNLPRDSLELMYTAWLKNSINRTLADEMYVATDISTNQTVGLITLKKLKDQIGVSIGLLAVSSNFRRRGIATALLSRAALWASEVTAWSKQGYISVVTQGANVPACQCYERFGCVKDVIQDIYHAWLPQHLEEPQQRSDHATVPFCKQYLTGKESEYINQVLNTGLDSAARFTMLCANGLREILGPESERVIVVPSGTAALEMAALLIDLKAGDEVVLPSYTFSSTANAIVLRGGIPVFVDVRSDTLNIDERLIERAITPKTVAICCVHYGGVPCEMDTICEIAKRKNLYVIEDAAQGFLSTYKGRQLGTIGHFGCFSFHYTKNVICGEGGAISINRSAHEAPARRALVLWEKGTNRYDFMTGKIDKYEWIDLGSSYVPNEVSCAILWAQLEQCKAITAARVVNFEKYRQGLNNLFEKGWLRLVQIPEGCHTNGHIFYMLFPTQEIRETVGRELKKRGISAFSHYVPLHSAPAGQKFGRVGAGCEKMQVTGDVFAGLLRLPVWVGLKPVEIDYVIASVSEVCKEIFEKTSSTAAAEEPKL